MSRANAAQSLPPGDRDELPSQDHAGQAGSAPGLAAPGADLMLDAVGRSLDDLTASFGELRLARRHDGWPAIEALARKHAALAQSLSRSITTARVQRAAAEEAGGINV